MLMQNKAFNELESILGYSFSDKGILELALTHSSYENRVPSSHRINNERLEFIGDGFLDAIVGRELYEIMPEATEGNLSKVRSSVVCEKSLAGIARKLEIGRFLLLGKSEEDNGGNNKDSILADAVEAIIGAMIIDSSYETAREFVLRICEENIKLAVDGKLFRDYKTDLQEILQKKYRLVRIEYVLVDATGPDHCKEFTMAVKADGKILGSGIGKSKKEAEQNAAKYVILKGEY